MNMKSITALLLSVILFSGCVTREVRGERNLSDFEPTRRLLVVLERQTLDESTSTPNGSAAYAILSQQARLEHHLETELLRVLRLRGVEAAFIGVNFSPNGINDSELVSYTPIGRDHFPEMLVVSPRGGKAYCRPGVAFGCWAELELAMKVVQRNTGVVVWNGNIDAGPDETGAQQSPATLSSLLVEHLGSNNVLRLSPVDSSPSTSK